MGGTWWKDDANAGKFGEIFLFFPYAVCTHEACTRPGFIFPTWRTSRRSGSGVEWPNIASASTLNIKGNNTTHRGKPPRHCTIGMVNMQILHPNLLSHNPPPPHESPSHGTFYNTKQPLAEPKNTVGTRGRPPHNLRTPNAQLQKLRGLNNSENGCTVWRDG